VGFSNWRETHGIDPDASWSVRAEDAMIDREGREGYRADGSRSVRRNGAAPAERDPSLWYRSTNGLHDS